jgi:hypothetical protein
VLLQRPHAVQRIARWIVDAADDDVSAALPHALGQTNNIRRQLNDLQALDFQGEPD